MMWGSPEELAVWQKMVDDFQAVNPNITVHVDVSDWNSYWDKLKTLYAGGTPPDIFAMDGPLFPDWQSRGVLLNLQPYIDATPGFLDGFYPVTLQDYKLPDGYYGLPRDFQTIVMFYNKDMFDKAGVAYPKAGWTWDDLRAMAKKLTISSGGKTSQWGFDGDLWDMEVFWSELIWAYGGDIVSADHTKTLLADPKAMQAWQFVSNLVKVDKSMPTPDAAAQYGDLFAAGVVAMWPMGHWAANDYSKVDFKFDVAPMPAGPAGQATSVNSAGMVVAKDTKHPAEAWKFIQFALSEKEQTRLADLGLEVPVLKSAAPAFLNQTATHINQQIFIDALQYAHVKPSFKGYDQWSSAVGDGMAPIWNGEKELGPTLAEVVKAADDALAQAK
jgi:multiple sugar transport system substrate-binding protein